MASKKVNPFHELYVTETISPDHFVKLFSPYLVKYVSALFQPGNVVVRGVQGSGKSMLLGLLKSEIRVAYERVGESWPVPEELSSFIGAGIHLIRSGAVDFGQRPIEADPESDEAQLPLYFGDFVNYWIVADILRSLETLTRALDGRLAHRIGIDTKAHALDAFSAALAKDSCWFGYFEGTSGYGELKEGLSRRIQAYRAFLNYNTEELPETIRKTKTTIGVPVAKAADYLRQSGVLGENVNIFVRIDQYEELCRLEDWSESLGAAFRRDINKALGSRDARVSYRIGARRHAWEDEPQLLGTTSRLERERDYKLVDIDALLRRQESRKGWIFPGFGRDVFARRVEHAGYHNGQGDDLLVQVMGKGQTPKDRALAYGGTSPRRALAVEDEWPEAWREYLLALASCDPLSAKLGEAWVRQNLARQGFPTSPPDSPPWGAKRYWRKERVGLALAQIAARCSQRMMWSGVNDILALCGGNILALVSLCQHVWSAWLQAERDRGAATEDLAVPRIDDAVQSTGIHTCSTYWHQKIPEQTGGNRRQRFVDELGRRLQRGLYGDKAMSYPGRNGFSVRVDELGRDEEVRRFLNDAVDNGDLHDARHTTKGQGRHARVKYYLEPILSPHFGLPVSHVKEPMYVGVAEVREWLVAAEVILPPKQVSLLPPDEDGGQQ